MDNLHQHARHPSVTSGSETPYASSDVSSSAQPFPRLPDNASRPLPAVASRNIRKLTIDSVVARPPSGSLPGTPPQQQRIRRKPLSSTASPIATRYSSGEYLSLARVLPGLEQRLSRSFSLDSPTGHDFRLAKVETVTVTRLGSLAGITKPTESEPRIG
jgi:hypothetical protein